MESLQQYDWELLFINDGSRDSTDSIIKEIYEVDNRISYICLTRNFGKENAMLAGFDYAKGDCVIIMDADLQDPPSLLLEMYYGIVIEGYDCVGTRRVTREGEPKIRSFFAKMFYKIINRIADIEMVDGARDYRLMTRQMVDAILEMKEYNRYTKGLFGFVGFETKWLEFENVERKAGKTKWSFFGLFAYALEGIIAFSTKPLMISAIIGFLFFIVSFIMIFVIIIKTLIFGDPVSGWPSTICIIFFVSGVQLFCLGIFGMYLSKAYLETKNRPLYFIKEQDKNSYK
jgi:glycosyltransferase involved in cell wall biosynthesis